MMTRITLTSTVAAALLAAGLITGCDRPANTPKPVAQAEAQQSKAADQSVALPPASLPPSDGAIKPTDPATSAAATPPATAGAPASQTQTAGSSGQAGGQTQSTPQDLTKAQEQSSQPLSGQANNHSTPESTDKQPGAKQN